MKNVFKRIRAASMHLIVLSFILIQAVGVSANNTHAHSLQLVTPVSPHFQDGFVIDLTDQEEPKLIMKSSEDEGNKNIYSFTLSMLNASVEKALDGIKQTHKPGASIAYEFREFELDSKSKTLKVTLDKNVLTQKQLLEYLQNRLDHALKQMK